MFISNPNWCEQYQKIFGGKSPYHFEGIGVLPVLRLPWNIWDQPLLWLAQLGKTQPMKNVKL